MNRCIAWLTAPACARAQVTSSEVTPSSPDEVLDPPGTVRAHRMTYREIYVDREWPTMLDTSRFPSDDWWPPTTYVPDLSEFVRKKCADDIDAYLDEVLP